MWNWRGDGGKYVFGVIPCGFADDKIISSIVEIVVARAEFLFWWGRGTSCWLLGGGRLKGQQVTVFVIVTKTRLVAVTSGGVIVLVIVIVTRRA